MPDHISHLYELQIYTWIGCNSAKFGHLYAAPLLDLLMICCLIKTQSNTVSVTSILGGASDNTYSSIARRLGISYIFEVGLVVGKGGETIKSLQTRTGTKIKIHVFTTTSSDAPLISETVGDDEYWSGIAQELDECPDVLRNSITMFCRVRYLHGCRHSLSNCLTSVSDVMVDGETVVAARYVGKGCEIVVEIFLGLIVSLLSSKLVPRSQ
ncbi:hypothetical protein C5167_020222 [Papaver somniferum]|uniref:K Homology domain-containing protein n=1 Tax=Papaver somniferum TaxID=3469 RepID=A0A4Y7ISD9_PAPSO|nr:hypothetical protein C5167_020222 [Papaver somniferum]